MDTFEHDHREFELDRMYAGDDKLYVRFFMKAHQDMGKTEEAGRPIFVEAEYVHIMVPGDKENIIIRPVRELDKRRFAKRYEAFKSGQKEGTIGTPLEAWPVLSLAQVEEVRYFGIRTVDQLANLRDDIALKTPGFMNLKQKAQEFIAKNVAGPTLEEFNALKAQLAALQAVPPAKDASETAVNGPVGAPQGGAATPVQGPPGSAPKMRRRKFA